jgi:alpha-L-fucosidase 2
MREYMPVRDFQIIFQNQSSSPANYERYLDVGDGTAGLYYTRGSTAYQRESFVSAPAGIMAVRLTASQPGSISFYMKMQRPSNQQNRFVEESYSENGDTIVSKIKEGTIEAHLMARAY